MINVIIVVVAVLLGAWLAFSKRLSKSPSWQATVTPLASIMGSGFLVSAPLLAGIVGTLALFCMGALLVLAYAVGGAIRFNIKHFEPIENKGHGPAQTIAFLSRIVLAGAYFISVTYYLVETLDILSVGKTLHVKVTGKLTKEASRKSHLFRLTSRTGGLCWFSPGRGI